MDQTLQIANEDLKEDLQFRTFTIVSAIVLEIAAIFAAALAGGAETVFVTVVIAICSVILAAVGICAAIAFGMITILIEIKTDSFNKLVQDFKERE
jgi:hypothetical protein